MTDQTDKVDGPEQVAPVSAPEPPLAAPAPVVAEAAPLEVAAEADVADVVPVEVVAAPAVAPVKAAPVKASKPAKVKVAPVKAAPAPAMVAPAPAPVEPVAAKPTARKAAVRRKPVPVKSPAAKVRKAPARRVAPASTASFTVTQLKDKIMATKTADFTATISKSMTEAVSEMQTKAQAAYDKGTGLVAEMTELAKGNVEAVVESGKIVATGMQDLGKTYAEEAKSAYETLTADIKEMAAIKSPTELFQLQGKIMRRNFDALVSTSSKNSETAMKLATEALAPISARVNLAVEKLSKAA